MKSSFSNNFLLASKVSHNSILYFTSQGYVLISFPFTSFFILCILEVSLWSSSFSCPYLVEHHFIQLNQIFVKYL